MKTKEQRRSEAIERAKHSYVSKNWEHRGLTLEQYLDKFRTKDEIEQRAYVLGIVLPAERTI